jgi:hypothetical protein
MNGRFIRLLQCFLLFAYLGYSMDLSAQKASSKPSAHASAQVPGKTDVCAMLSSAEIQAVQGEGVEESKSSPQSSEGLAMSECLFRTTTPAKSVSLALAVPGKQNPRDFWRKHFHAEAEASKPATSAKPAKASPQNEKKHAREEEETRPRPITGVGDEAFWMGGPISGALYVLRGNFFIRVSVGGVRDESARIKKSVALARSALKRIQP